jgi:hypothetical protein
MSSSLILLCPELTTHYPTLHLSLIFWRRHSTWDWGCRSLVTRCRLCSLPPDYRPYSCFSNFKITKIINIIFYKQLSSFQSHIWNQGWVKRGYELIFINNIRLDAKIT